MIHGRELPVTSGALLRDLRKARKLPLRSIAAVAEMDSTLLSKIELGRRLPTEEQTRALARFFNVSFEDFEAKRLAERFWSEHGDSPAISKAAALITAAASERMTRRIDSGK